MTTNLTTVVKNQLFKLKTSPPHKNNLSDAKKNSKRSPVSNDIKLITVAFWQIQNINILNIFALPVIRAGQIPQWPPNFSRIFSAAKFSHKFGS